MKISQVDAQISCDEKSARSYLKSVMLILTSSQEESELLGKRNYSTHKLDDDYFIRGPTDLSLAKANRIEYGGPIKKLKEASAGLSIADGSTFYFGKRSDASFTGFGPKNDYSDYLPERTIPHLNILNEDIFKDNSVKYNLNYSKELKKYGTRKTTRRIVDPDEKSETKEGRLDSSKTRIVKARLTPTFSLWLWSRLQSLLWQQFHQSPLLLIRAQRSCLENGTSTHITVLRHHTLL